MALTSKQHSRGAKPIVCTYCGAPGEAAQRAMSIFCPKCHKRVILEDFKIRGYYGVKEFYTCGDISVEKGGHVVAPIKVCRLTVKGHVQGRIQARGAVVVGRSGSLTGDLEAPSLTVEAGGKYCGFVRIQPPDASRGL